MGKGHRISISAGAGLSIVTLAIGVAASVWPEYIKPHPYWLGGFFVIGVILMLLPSVIKFPSRTLSDKPNGELIENSNSVGRDNYGKQINAKTVHYHEAATAPNESLPAPMTSLPALQFRAFIKDVRFEDGKGIWTSNTNSSRGIAIEVRNPRPPVGELGRRLEAVIAHLLFVSEETGERVEIDRAYWINSSANAVTLDIAEGKTVLACIATTRYLMIYKNPSSRPIHYTRLGRGRIFAVGPLTRIPVSQSIRLTLSVLLSRESRTVAERSFRIRFQGLQPNIEEIAEPI